MVAFFGQIEGALERLSSQLLATYQCSFHPSSTDKGTHCSQCLRQIEGDNAVRPEFDRLEDTTQRDIPIILDGLSGALVRLHIEGRKLIAALLDELTPLVFFMLDGHHVE